VGYDGLYIFKYSERKGTPAANFEDNVTKEEKSDRFARLENVQRQFQKQIYEHYLGRELSVLVERESSKSPTDMTGHSTCHKVVNFPADDSLLGRVVNIRITQAKQNSLYGELNSAP